MNKTKYFKFLPIILLALSLIKSIDGQKTYFQIFYMILGLYSFINYELWKNKIIWIISSIFILNMGIAYLVSDNVQWLEYIQLGGLISIIWYLREKFSTSEYLLYSKFVTIISLAISTFYFFFTLNIYGERSYLGIKRVAGIIGEPNYSAFALIFPWLLFYKNKNYKWLFISTISLFWTESRSIIIVILIIFIFDLIKQYAEKALPKIKSLCFLGIVISPFFVAIGYELASPSMKSKLIHSVTTRFYLTRYYVELGIKNPLGVGLSNGLYYYEKNGDIFRKQTMQIIDENPPIDKSKHTYVEKNEQHSIFTQLISEFGIISFLALFIYIFKSSRYRPAKWESITIACIAACMFINGFNELTTFLLIGYQLRNLSIKQNETYAT